MRHDVIVQVQASWLFVFAMVWYLHYIRFLPASQRPKPKTYVSLHIGDPGADPIAVPGTAYERISNWQPEGWTAGFDVGINSTTMVLAYYDHGVTYFDRVMTVYHDGAPTHLWARDLRHGKDAFTIMEAIEGWAIEHG